MSNYDAVYIDSTTGNMLFLDRAINSGVAQFKYIQNVEASIWTLYHKQSSDKFVLKISDENGNKIYPDRVNIFDKDTITIYFSSPIRGNVVLIFFDIGIAQILPSVTPTLSVTPTISLTTTLSVTPTPTPTISVTPSLSNVVGQATQLATPPDFRNESSGGVINRELYVFGGRNSSNNITNTLWKYTPDTNMWTVLQSGATARADHSAAGCDGKFYVHGGSTSNGYSNDMWCYDPLVDTWTQLSSGGDIAYYTTMVSIGTKLYVFGGLKTGTYYNSLWCYDTTLDSWTKLSSGPSARYGHAATVMDGIIYISGGHTSSESLSDLWSYDPATDTWTNLGNGINSHYYHAAAGINGKIYIKYTDLSYYDTSTQTWSSLSNTGGQAIQASYGVIDNQFYFTGSNELWKISNL